MSSGNMNAPASETVRRIAATGEHGAHCSCRLLAMAAGAEPSVIDYALCRSVLQRRWRITCDHFPLEPRIKVTREPPPHDADNPLHALLIANADISPD